MRPERIWCWKLRYAWKSWIMMMMMMNKMLKAFEKREGGGGSYHFTNKQLSEENPLCRHFMMIMIILNMLVWWAKQLQSCSKDDAEKDKRNTSWRFLRKDNMMETKKLGIWYCYHNNCVHARLVIDKTFEIGFQPLVVNQMLRGGWFGHLWSSRGTIQIHQLVLFQHTIVIISMVRGEMHRKLHRWGHSLTVHSWGDNLPASQARKPNFDFSFGKILFLFLTTISCVRETDLETNICLDLIKIHCLHDMFLCEQNIVFQRSLMKTRI